MDSKNNKLLVMIITISVLVIGVTGATFAYWSWMTVNNQKTEITFTVSSGFSCSADGGGNITSSNVQLMPAECTNSAHAIKRTIHTNVTNQSGTNVLLNMWLSVDHQDQGLRNSKNFKYALTTSGSNCTTGVVTKGSFYGVSDGDEVILLDNNVYSTSSADTYYLWIWLDKEETSSDTQNQTFTISLGGVCSNALDNDSQPNAPELSDGMIPVTIANNGTVTTVAEDDPDWYDYSNKKWANAVLVKESGVKTRAQNKTAGTTINQSDILAYYVWIPRFRYSMKTCPNVVNVNPTSNPECYGYTLTTQGRNNVLDTYTLMLMSSMGINQQTARTYAINNVNTFIDNYGEERIIQYAETNGFSWLSDDDKAVLAQVAVSQEIVNDTEEAYDMYNYIVNVGSLTELRLLIDMVHDYNDNLPNGYSAISPAFDYEDESVLINGIQKESSINIIFESATSPKATGLALDNSYYTHPAFTTYSNDELSGFWVSKFNVTGTSANPTILPNVGPIDNYLPTLFQTSLSFAGGTLSNNGNVTFSGSSTYGLSSADNSHILKSRDWGAILYLSHSKYGINGEIASNNFANWNGYDGNYDELYRTGCGTSTTPSYNSPQSDTCEIAYGMANSYPQSTTGNISGVFDMAGSAGNIVMGNYNGLDASYNGFSTFPTRNYYDLYTFSSIYDCDLSTCGGHALYETLDWYSDRASRLPNSEFPWLGRGSDFDFNNGAFYFSDNSNRGVFHTILIVDEPTL